MCLVLVLSFLVTDVVAKKKMYKWVDENGNVTYSDRVPPKLIKNKHEELSNQGVVLEKVGNAITEDEVKAQREAAKRKKKADKLAAEKEIVRLNIIKAYTNESEIIRLKEERLDALKRNIELANQSLVFQEASKEELLSRAADNERNGIEISTALKSRIKIIEDKIKYQKKFIVIKQNEIENVEKRFAKDLATYREAKSGK